jgi:alanine dehydrogenase
VVGLVGSGVQAQSQLDALRCLFRVEKVNVWGNTAAAVKSFLENFRNAPFGVKVCRGVSECVKDCDIVVTATPSRKPLVKLEWLKPGTHVNAIGADGPGKEEMDPRILKKGKVVVDSWEQASHSGEINVPVRKGLLHRQDIYAELGEIVAGRKKGRGSQEEITIFDSTGLAIQDLSVASRIYERALRRKAGTKIQLL